MPQVIKDRPRQPSAPTAVPTELVTSDLSDNAARAGARRLDSLKVVTFPARMFLALGWMRAGVEKAISVEWWTGSELNTFLAVQRDHALPFMGPIIDNVLVPAVVPLTVAVVALQFAIAFGLVRARRLRSALLAGMALNVIFVLLGAVTPSAFYLVLQLTVLAALGERDRRQTAPRVRWFRASLCLVAGAAMLPFAQTVHPAEVIDDPALMLATIATLCASIDVLRIGQATIARDEAQEFQRAP